MCPQLPRPDARGVTSATLPPDPRNRTITVISGAKRSNFKLLGDRKAFSNVVLAFVLSLGFQLKTKPPVAAVMPHAPFALCACPSGGITSGDSVHDMSRRVYILPAFHLALSPDAT